MSEVVEMNSGETNGKTIAIFKTCCFIDINGDLYSVFDKTNKPHVMYTVVGYLTPSRKIILEKQLTRFRKWGLEVHDEEAEYQ